MHNTAVNFCSDAVSGNVLKQAISTLVGMYCGSQTALRACTSADVIVTKCETVTAAAWSAQGGGAGAAAAGRRLLSNNAHSHVSTWTYSVAGGGNSNQQAAVLASSASASTVTAALRQGSGASVSAASTASSSASGDGNGQSCGAGYEQIGNSTTCTPCPAGKSSDMGMPCAACTGNTFTDAPGQAPCRPHTECDPWQTSPGPTHGVTNVTGTATTDTTCVVDDCAKMITAHGKDCKTATDALKCTRTANLSHKCVGIRNLYRDKGCVCP